MKKCCKSKLESVVILFNIRIQGLIRKKHELDKLLKDEEGQVDNFQDRLAEHLSVISYRVELISARDLVEKLIKEGL